MKILLIGIVGVVLNCCCLSCKAQEATDLFTESEAAQNATEFAKSVFGAKEPSISDHMIYSGVGNEAEWLTQLKGCLGEAGIVVSAREAASYQDSCKKELLGDASAPSEYYAAVRDVLPRHGLRIGEASVSSTDTNNQHYSVRVDITGGHVQIFHILERAQEDLGLVRVDYIELDGVRYEVENAIGDVELEGW